MIEERVAKLEVQIELLKETTEKMLKETEALNLRLSKYQGFIGGVFFVGSCFYYLVMMSKDGIITWVKSKFGG